MAAAAKCIISQKNGTMKTKTLNSELIYSLSPSLHVTDSLKQFGLSPNLQYVLVVAFDQNPSEVIFTSFYDSFCVV